MRGHHPPCFLVLLHLPKGGHRVSPGAPSRPRLELLANSRASERFTRNFNEVTGRQVVAQERLLVTVKGYHTWAGQRKWCLNLCWLEANVLRTGPMCFCFCFFFCVGCSKRYPVRFKGLRSLDPEKMLSFLASPENMPHKDAECA